MKRLSLGILIALAELPALAEARASESSEASLASAASNLNPTEYQLSGNQTVRPSSIHDDGARTYIRWEPAQSIPAVFGLDERGSEELVNGYMRDGSFTIDRVYARLVFRIDDATASARRKPARKR